MPGETKDGYRKMVLVLFVEEEKMILLIQTGFVCDIYYATIIR